jgi:hypothetical protein
MQEMIGGREAQPMASKDRHPGVGFTRWLRRQCDRQDPVGQLGRFAVEDPCWVASKYRSVVIYHLREAWREFREFKKGG